jgi:hypothetical protein
MATGFAMCALNLGNLAHQLSFPELANYSSFLKMLALDRERRAENASAAASTSLASLTLWLMKISNGRGVVDIGELYGSGWKRENPADRVQTAGITARFALTSENRN